MTILRLYLDDVRNPPDDGGGPWTVCRSLDAAKALLLAGVDEASLDHDLGHCDACRSDLGPDNCPHVGTGYDLVKWMAEHGAAMGRFADSRSNRPTHLFNKTHSAGRGDLTCT